MKLDINIPEHNIAIAKYIAGEMTTTDMEEFEREVSTHPENELLLKEMTKYWNRMELLKKNHRIDVDNAWDKLYSKIKDDKIVAETKKVYMAKSQWLAWAAAVILLFSVGSVLLFTNTFSGKQIIVQAVDNSSTLVHTLSDGSVVYLSSNTTISYSKSYGKRNRNLWLEGEAFFDVIPNQKLPFVIETSSAVVKVLGTSFTLKSNEKEIFELLVESGSVSISSKTKEGETLIADAGDMVTLTNSNFTKSSMADKYQASWKNQRLQFKDESISSILQVINKNYNTSIILEPRLPGSTRITVTFHNNNIHSIVEVICATLNLEPKYINDTITLTLPADVQ